MCATVFNILFFLSAVCVCLAVLCDCVYMWLLQYSISTNVDIYAGVVAL